jgi:hypothetical protein
MDNWRHRHAKARRKIAAFQLRALGENKSSEEKAA